MGPTERARGEDIHDAPVHPPSCAQHVGDISYGRNTPIKWEVFGDTIKNVAAHTPYMVEAGNHESDVVSGGDKSPLFAAWDNSTGGYVP